MATGLWNISPSEALMNITKITPLLCDTDRTHWGFGGVTALDCEM